MADSITGSQTGTPLGTSYVSDAKTAQKIEVLRRKNPSLADFVCNLFGIQNISSVSPNSTANKPDNIKDLDRHSRNVLQTLFSPELTLHQTSGKGSAAASGGAAPGDIRGNKDSINETLKPVSSAIGSTLGTLTNVLKNPIGAPMAIGKTMEHMMDKVHPGFTDKLDSSFKNFKSSELSHLSTQVFGGLRSLLSSNGQLALPQHLTPDTYGGMKQIY